MNKKLVLLSALALVGSGTLMAQKRVTGRILDTDGQPVYGAHVKVEGTDIVTATDAEGRFTLTNVPSSAKRVSVSYIGMQTQTVSISGNMNVVLEQNDRLLEEAVVVGYGTAKKIGSVTGAITKVNAESVTDKPNVNVLDALQGQVSGLQIFNQSGDASNINSFSMNIRGIGSLGDRTSNTPLIIVDGSPAGTTAFSLMNDDDIESITVLKDASATAIYGSRAANGVIYITTKKGRRNEKAQVTVSQSIGWSQLARGIGNPMNSTELLDFQFENGIITPDQYVMYKQHGANTNWQDYNFDNAAPQYETSLTVQGGSANTSYFLSTSYLKSDGLTPKSALKRYTLRANIESKINDWLTIGLNQTAAYSERVEEFGTQNGPKYGNTGNYSVASYMFPAYWDPYDPESRKKHMVWGSGDYDNHWIYEQHPNTANDITYNGTGFIQLNPVRGLTLRSQLGLYAIETRGTEKLLPTLPGIGTGAGALESHTRWSLWTITNTAEYKFNIGTDHAFTLLAGQEGIKYTEESFIANGTGLTDDRLTELDNATIAQLPSSGYNKYEYLSFFGRVDYALKEKYFANFTVRSDASSRFGRDNRTALFYSGGLLWNMKKEAFMEPVTWISALQVKASVGSTGNSEIGNYTHLGLISQTQYAGTAGWYLSQPANTELGWEKQIQTNVGFNISFLNKLHIDFSWYNRLTKDMLMTMPLPYTTGFSAQMMNIGQLLNRGVEVEVVWDAIRTDEAYLTLRANYAYNKNKIVKLFNGITEWPIEGKLINYIEGQSLNYYMPIYAGVDKEDGAPMWYLPGHSGEAGHTFNPETMTKDANMLSDLYQDTGKSRFAPHTGGFGIAGGWKGLTISADFAFVLGKWMVNNDAYFANSRANAINGFNQDKDMLNVWKKPGDETALPSMEYETQFDTHVLENASFLRLKNLTVAYDLPKTWMKASGFFTNIRLMAQARNLFTVTKYSGADPEFDSNLSLGAYPATRTYTLGVEVTF